MTEHDNTSQDDAQEETQETPAPESGPRHHVTNIRTVERQVGDHVMAALEDEDTVAVLTTIVGGIRTDRIVSMPLNGAQAAAVSELLQAAQDEATQDEEDEHGRREGFLGFHAVLSNTEQDEDA
jgi:hypothetical protein